MLRLPLFLTSYYKHLVRTIYYIMATIPEAFADFPRRMTKGNVGIHWHIFNPIFLNHAGLQLRHEMHGGLLPSLLPQAEYEVLLHPHLQADNIPAAPGVFDPAVDDATVWKAMRTAYTLYT
jgi:hypothetical protein